MIELIDQPKLFTFIAFALWAIFTAIYFATAIFKPEWIDFKNPKLNLHNPLDVLAVASISSWLAMWCFRSMY